ncbi:MAG: hypothetical protein A2X56_11585 [Nitrospirae bacterium GWC2_57_13]|nr:MAG: hypothetical protein A2072_03670 [Nitrospirae bacterium GWC1_57_7]OGW27509.1 MAG: hypothetical protein A2X56_11585 [Nitrospirae bacterium GWC2_57_13]
MKRYGLVSVCLFLLFILVAPWVVAQTVGKYDAVETVGPGTINWTSGEAFATGIGAPPSGALNPAQIRAMTERAAFVVAVRNLLETVKGVRVDSTTLVENFMVTSEVIRTRVEGVVRGARVVNKRYLSDGSVEMVVSMPFKGEFMNVVLPEDFGGTVVAPLPKPVPAPKRPQDPKPAPRPPAPEPLRPEPVRPVPEPVQPQPVMPPPPPDPTAQFTGGKATGLVIDGTGLGLRPALMPRIVDHQGNEIYVGRVVTRTNAAEQGVAGYAKDVNAASGNFRVTDNPLVMKGARAVGAGRTDIMLSQADARTLRDLAEKSDFLKYSRVIIVY